MARPNYELRSTLKSTLPHSVRALTYLVPAMEAAFRAQGRGRSIFGKDVAADAYGKFLGAVLVTVKAMAEDGTITMETPAREVYETLCGAVRLFQEAYPNWPVAYAYADTMLNRDAPRAAVAGIVKDCLADMKDADSLWHSAQPTRGHIEP